MFIMIDREDNPKLHIAITPAHHPSSLVHIYSDDINENELNGILIRWHRHCFTWNGRNFKVISLISDIIAQILKEVVG